jgi:hypothetical protein
MRNLEITASTYIDGGICCLSGRTAAYRTSILRDPDFQWKFTHEFWLGKYLQHSGDDKFLTRWMHSHYWKTYVQACPEAELLSTFKNNSKFLLQLLRWTRNTWRSDLRSIFIERHIWSRHPYVAYTMVDKFFNPLTLLAGPATVIYVMTKEGTGLPSWAILASYLVWLLLTRLIKYMPHFVRRPQDCIYIPVWLVFNIYFVLLKVYCLFTLHVTDWGTRSGADDKNGENDISEIFVPHWDDDDDDTMHSDESIQQPKENSKTMYQLPAQESGQGRLAESFAVYGMEPSLNYSLQHDVGSGSLGLDFQAESIMESEFSEGITTMNHDSSESFYESEPNDYVEVDPGHRSANTLSLDLSSHDDYLTSLKYL